jgi:hypothetical protein
MLQDGKAGNEQDCSSKEIVQLELLKLVKSVIFMQPKESQAEVENVDKVKKHSLHLTTRLQLNTTETLFLGYEGFKTTEYGC